MPPTQGPVTLTSPTQGHVTSPTQGHVMCPIQGPVTLTSPTQGHVTSPTQGYVIQSGLHVIMGPSKLKLRPSKLSTTMRAQRYETVFEV